MLSANSNMAKQIPNGRNPIPFSVVMETSACSPVNMSCQFVRWGRSDDDSDQASSFPFKLNHFVTCLIDSSYFRIDFGILLGIHEA